MFKWFSSMPIFRRLFLAFFLAVLIPDLIMLALSLFYTHALLAHGVSSQETGPFTLGTILALLASTAVVVLLGSLVNSTITHPLTHLASLAKRIRKGETDARALITGRDEIALVALSINTMLDQIVTLLQETRGQRDGLQEQVEQLIEEVSDVGNGNLNRQATVTHGSLGVLADTFNYMLEQLSALVIRVKRVAREVEGATGDTQQDMLHLVGSAERQLQQISQTASTIEMMARSFRQVAERTQRLDQAAREAQQAARQGRQRVDETLQGMQRLYQHARSSAAQVTRLGERSQEIEALVGVLENIAQHTQRLALDAAIQVAMAGGTTSGFGAVAEGMRRLSEQTKAQLSMVARNVKSVRSEILSVAHAVQESERETATGVARIQVTGDALTTIFTLVEHQAAEIGAIAQMMEQLLASARSLSETMQAIAEYDRESCQDEQRGPTDAAPDAPGDAIASVDGGLYRQRSVDASSDVELAGWRQMSTSSQRVFMQTRKTQRWKDAECMRKGEDTMKRSQRSENRLVSKTSQPTSTESLIKTLTRNGIVTLLILLGLFLVYEWPYLSTSTGRLVCLVNGVGVILLVGSGYASTLVHVLRRGKHPS